MFHSCTEVSEFGFVGLMDAIAANESKVRDVVKKQHAKKSFNTTLNIVDSSRTLAIASFFRFDPLSSPFSGFFVEQRFLLDGD